MCLKKCHQVPLSQFNNLLCATHRRLCEGQPCINLLTSGEHDAVWEEFNENLEETYDVVLKRHSGQGLSLLFTLPFDGFLCLSKHLRMHLMTSKAIRDFGAPTLGTSEMSAW